MNKNIAAAAAVIFFALPATPVAAQSLSDYAVYADDEAKLGTVIITGSVAGRPVDKSFTAMVSGGTTASSDALTDAAVYNSATMAAMAPTAGTSFTGSPNATLSSVSPGTTVYSLSGADWEALSTLTFAGASTGAIINVGGTSLTKALNINLGSLLASDVIFNFYEATSLDFSGAVNFHGTILAPNANVKLAGVNLFGAVISDTFESPSANIQHRGYTGFLTPQSAVPEPATWAMMIMGFGLAAGALRRRKTAPGALAAA